jgi:uncharacterized membrane protein YeaQ/YmgE (transglycosylase-associated protein family)
VAEVEVAMDWVGLIVSLVSGAVGGNVAGGLMPERSLGTGGNSLAGIVGGGLGAAILQGLGVLATHGAGGIDLGSILGEVVGGGVGGAVVLALFSLLRGATAKA